MKSKPLLGVVLAAVLTASACGGSDSTGSDDVSSADASSSEESTSTGNAQVEETSSSEAAETTETTEAQEAEDTTTTEVTEQEPLDVGRVVVLAEESTLADVLALGIPVVASSATVPNVGFQGLDEYDVEGIEIFDYLTLNLEELALYKADHIIVWELIVSRVGEEQLAGLGATLHILPDGASVRERLNVIAEDFDRTDKAAELIASLDAAIEAGKATVPEDCSASVVAIYPGPSPALFVKPVWDAPRSISDLGCDLVPSETEIDSDRNGRAFISLEEIGLISGPEIIMLQSSTVEGEDTAVDEIQASPLWSQLPAVQAGQVSRIDRLGYPGINGQIRLIEDLLEILAS